MNVGIVLVSHAYDALPATDTDMFFIDPETLRDNVIKFLRANYPEYVESMRENFDSLEKNRPPDGNVDARLGSAKHIYDFDWLGSPLTIRARSGMFPAVCTD